MDINTGFASALLPLTVTFGIFTVVGVVGNIVVLVVFVLGRAYRRNNFRVFVICLGIIDLLTSAFLIPAEMVKHRKYFAFENALMCKIKCLFNVWASCAAALSLLIVSVDRYRKVCKPLQRQITQKLAWKLCVILSFLVSVILAIPGAVLCGIKETNMTDFYGNGSIVYICATEDRYANHILRHIYKNTFLILFLGVSISCIVMYILIGKQIFKHWGSVKVNFHQNSVSEFSSETFGQMNASPEKKPIDRVDSAVTLEIKLQVTPPPSPILTDKAAMQTLIDGETRQRPPLVKQKSSIELETHKSFTKQISQTKSSLKQKNSDTNGRRTTLLRQSSGLGLRRFPYKTLIWFILTLIFIVTYIVYLALTLKIEKIITMTPKSFAIFQAFYRLYFINNIVNPIVYTILDKNFREACRTIWPRLVARFKDCHLQQ